MLYVSDFRYNKNKEKEWGITDSDDNITEYYTEAQVYDILGKIGFTSIYGARYTGSSIKFERVTPAIVEIDRLPRDTGFEISFDGIVHRYIKCDILGAGNGWHVLYNGKPSKIMKKSLLDNKDKIEFIGVV